MPLFLLFFDKKFTVLCAVIALSFISYKTRSWGNIDILKLMFFPLCTTCLHVLQKKIDPRVQKKWKRVVSNEIEIVVSVKNVNDKSDYSHLIGNASESSSNLISKNVTHNLLFTKRIVNTFHSSFDSDLAQNLFTK